MNNDLTPNNDESLSDVKKESNGTTRRTFLRRATKATIVLSVVDLIAVSAMAASENCSNTTIFPNGDSSCDIYYDADEQCQYTTAKYDEDAACINWNTTHTADHACGGKENDADESCGSSSVPANDRTDEHCQRWGGDSDHSA
jgi:hypothetical protein